MSTTGHRATCKECDPMSRFQQDWLTREGDYRHEAISLRAEAYIVHLRAFLGSGHSLTITSSYAPATVTGEAGELYCPPSISCDACNGYRACAACGCKLAAGMFHRKCPLEVLFRAGVLIEELRRAMSMLPRQATGLPWPVLDTEYKLPVRAAHSEFPPKRRVGSHNLGMLDQLGLYGSLPVGISKILNVDAMEEDVMSMELHHATGGMFMGHNLEMSIASTHAHSKHAGDKAAKKARTPASKAGPVPPPPSSPIPEAFTEVLWQLNAGQLEALRRGEEASSLLSGELLFELNQLELPPAALSRHASKHAAQKEYEEAMAACKVTGLATAAPVAAVDVKSFKPYVSTLHTGDKKPLLMPALKYVEAAPAATMVPGGVSSASSASAEVLGSGHELASLVGLQVEAEAHGAPSMIASRLGSLSRKPPILPHFPEPATISDKNSLQTTVDQFPSDDAAAVSTIVFDFFKTLAPGTGDVPLFAPKHSSRTYSGGIGYGGNASDALIDAPLLAPKHSSTTSSGGIGYGGDAADALIVSRLVAVEARVVEIRACIAAPALQQLNSVIRDVPAVDSSLKEAVLTILSGPGFCDGMPVRARLQEETEEEYRLEVLKATVQEIADALSIMLSQMKATLDKLWMVYLQQETEEGAGASASGSGSAHTSAASSTAFSLLKSSLGTKAVTQQQLMAGLRHAVLHRSSPLHSAYSAYMKAYIDYTCARSRFGDDVRARMHLFDALDAEVKSRYKCGNRRSHAGAGDGVHGPSALMECLSATFSCSVQDMSNQYGDKLLAAIRQGSQLVQMMAVSAATAPLLFLDIPCEENRLDFSAAVATPSVPRLQLADIPQRTMAATCLEFRKQARAFAGMLRNDGRGSTDEVSDGSSAVACYTAIMAACAAGDALETCLRDGHSSGPPSAEPRAFSLLTRAGSCATSISTSTSLGSSSSGVASGAGPAWFQSVPLRVVSYLSPGSMLSARGTTVLYDGINALHLGVHSLDHAYSPSVPLMREYGRVLADQVYVSVPGLAMAQPFPHSAGKAQAAGASSAAYDAEAGRGAGKRMRKVAAELAGLSADADTIVAWQSSLLLRSDESSLDHLSAAITGPLGTPYANGFFTFALHIPRDYPDSPPLVKFLTTGGGTVRFNPNLYHDGKVCLSLLGTWAGPGWMPGVSSIRQVLQSLQTQVLIDRPYGNEPGYAAQLNSATGHVLVARHNADLRVSTLRHAILAPLARPPIGYEMAAAAHFYLKREEVRAQVVSWAEEALALAVWERDVEEALSRTALAPSSDAAVSPAPNLLSLYATWKAYHPNMVLQRDTGPTVSFGTLGRDEWLEKARAKVEVLAAAQGAWGSGTGVAPGSEDVYTKEEGEAPVKRRKLEPIMEDPAPIATPAFSAAPVASGATCSGMGSGSPMLRTALATVEAAEAIIRAMETIARPTFLNETQT